MSSHPAKGITRSVHLSSSLHYSSFAHFKEANGGMTKLEGQSTQGFDNGYGLQGNPTLHELQDEISDLEQGSHTLLYPSGLTALTALCSLLRPGDHWLLSDGSYAPLKRYAAYLQKQFGVLYDTYDHHDPRTLESLITPQTKLIHIESPCSVTFETVNIQEIVAIAKKHAVLTSADNTWASGVLCKPLALGVDMSIVSLTKYVAGHSDVFTGSLTTSNKDLFTELVYHHRIYGYTVSPVSAMLVQRGLETLAMRLAAHGVHAAKLIEAIKHYPQVAKMHYADSQTSPELSGSNGLFSVELDRFYDDAELETPLSALGTFTIGESWGGTRSLVLPFQPDYFADRVVKPQGTILRFHAGLEANSRQLEDIHTLFDQL